MQRLHPPHRCWLGNTHENTSFFLVIRVSWWIPVEDFFVWEIFLSTVSLELIFFLFFQIPEKWKKFWKKSLKKRLLEKSFFIHFFRGPRKWKMKNKKEKRKKILKKWQKSPKFFIFSSKTVSFSAFWPKMKNRNRRIFLFQILKKWKIENEKDFEKSLLKNSFYFKFSEDFE